MEQKELAMTFFARNPALYVHMSELLRLDRGELLACRENGVLMARGSLCLMGAASAADVAELLSGIPDTMEELVVCGRAAADAAREWLDLEETCECWQAVYLRQEKLPVCGDIRQLDGRYFHAVLEGYSLFQDETYIASRLEAGVMYGIFVEDELAGFIGEHDEGSMGMLEVFPAYRRQGLGLALESFQINRILEEGRMPYDQVILGNEKSLSLQKKLGMTITKDTVTWLKRK